VVEKIESSASSEVPSFSPDDALACIFLPNNLRLAFLIRLALVGHNQGAHRFA